VITVRLSIIAFFKLFSLRDFRWRLPRRLELDEADDDSDDWDESELLGLGDLRGLDLRLCLFGDGERLLEGLLLDPRLLRLDLDRDLIDLERNSHREARAWMLRSWSWTLIRRCREVILLSYSCRVFVDRLRRRLHRFCCHLFWIWSLAKTSWARSSKGLDVGASERLTFVAA
jgi:hypothetical protein